MIVEIINVESRISKTGRSYLALTVKDDYDNQKFLFVTNDNLTKAELEYQLKIPNLLWEPAKNLFGKLLSVTERRVQYEGLDRDMLMLNINVVRLGLFPETV